MSIATTARWPRRLSETQSIDVLRAVVRLVIGVVLIAFLLVEIYPVFWIVLSSFKTADEFILSPIYTLPQGVHVQNYVDAVNAGMGRYLLNSVIATVPAVAIIVAVSSLAAFAIEILNFRYARQVLVLFVFGLMIPAQMILLPLFSSYYKIGLVDSLVGLIAIYVGMGLPLSIFLLCSHLRSFPKELIGAAVVDGASVRALYWKIVLPMMLNSLTTVALVQFFFLWNELLLSLTFIHSASKKTIQTGLLVFVGEYGEVSWGPTFASITIAILPTLLVYFFLNKRVIEGMSNGAVKG